MEKVYQHLIMHTYIIIFFHEFSTLGTTIFRNGDIYSGNYLKGFLTGSGKIK